MKDDKGKRISKEIQKEVLREYMADIGRKGGQAIGASKTRGDFEYYSKMGKRARALAAAKALEKRRKKQTKKKAHGQAKRIMKKRAKT